MKKRQQHPPPLDVKKRRRPTDSTIRNVRAANKRIAALTARVRELEQKMRWFEMVAAPSRKR